MGGNENVLEGDIRTKSSKCQIRKVKRGGRAYFWTILSEYLFSIFFVMRPLEPFSTRKP